MAPVFRSRFFRECFALFFVSASLIVGCYGLLLFINALSKYGSPVGNTFPFVLGLFLLIFSPLVLIFGLINWRKAYPSTDGADN
jgi:hypothetical protein